MEEVYRKALRQIAEQAKAADMDVAIGWAVLSSLLDENDRLRRDRGHLLSASRAAIRIANGEEKTIRKVSQIATRLELAVRPFGDGE